MPEDRESRNSALIVQEIFEANPDADWTLKCIQYDATGDESKTFRKGSRRHEGFVDVLEYDRNVLRGNCNAQTSLYPPMFRNKGCMFHFISYYSLIPLFIHCHTDVYPF